MLSGPVSFGPCLFELMDVQRHVPSLEDLLLVTQVVLLHPHSVSTFYHNHLRGSRIVLPAGLWEGAPRAWADVLFRAA